MDTAFISIVIIGVILTIVILLKLNKISVFSFFKKKAKKDNTEKKEKSNFIPKSILKKPKMLFNKNKKVEDDVKKDDEIKNSSISQSKVKQIKPKDPSRVHKITKEDFDKYKIEIPQTSNLYSAEERAQFIKKPPNIAKRLEALKKDELNLPNFRSKSKDSKQFNFDDINFDGPDDFNDGELDNFDFIDDDFDDLFTDEDFSKIKNITTANSTPIIEKKESISNVPNVSPIQAYPSRAEVPNYPNGDIIDTRSTFAKYSNVFTDVFNMNQRNVSEIIISKVINEPAYISRQRREEIRKKRLGFM